MADTPPAAPKPAAAKTKTFTVAKGRTIEHVDPNDGVHEREPRVYRAGEEVELSVKEGARLQRLGFLLNDDGTTTVRVGGPPTEAGNEISEPAGAASGEGRVSITEA